MKSAAVLAEEADARAKADAACEGFRVWDEEAYSAIETQVREGEGSGQGWDVEWKEQSSGHMRFLSHPTTGHILHTPTRTHTHAHTCVSPSYPQHPPHHTKHTPTQTNPSTWPNNTLSHVPPPHPKKQTTLGPKRAAGPYEVAQEHIEILVQFGYVSMFAVAFPLAPILAFFNNVRA